MKYHYVWLIWSSAFLLPWIALYLAAPAHRRVMWRASLATSLLGVTEPLYVPAYWNPPSLFDLAQRTRFDIESLVFCFAIGGIGAILYNVITGQDLVPVSDAEKRQSRHRFHPVALLAPYVLFVPLYFLPWNPIYPSIVCLVIGAAAAVICRPDLKWKTFVGGFLFLGLYALLMLGLRWFASGYIEQVWNLPALSGVTIYGIPLEELLFGFAFGLYWTGVYEHFTWNRSLAHSAGRTDRAPGRPRPVPEQWGPE
ncbi:MAG: lycopene cyclase domain-containing protein [Burkholderiales bacterium]